MVTRASAKAAGREWEGRVALFMSDVWPKVERRRQAGRFDRGDLINTEPWVVECKATRTIDLAGGCDEARQEAVNAGAQWWVLVVKRRNKPASRAYVVMDLQQFHDLIAQEKP
jgi:hypothetical protein